MKKKIIAIAIASVITTTSAQVLASPQEEGVSNNKKQYTAISVGAVSGALLAGPVGLVVGGIVGAIAGRDHSDPEAREIDHLAETESMLSEMLDTAKQTQAPSETMLATADSAMPVIDSNAPEIIDSLKQIVSNDLSMDVYFKAGSIDVEPFYAQKLTVITSLLTELPDLRLKLDGYSDRQGSASENLQLSAARLQSVREHFVKNGIDENRITVRAHGEKNFLSKPGELEKYVFDRRVVLSFEAPAGNTQNNVAAITGASSL
ncbi:MAG: sortase-associated OmpA-like protein PdsO [Gammaproteobacteria bacterium]|nr:sortase-associated OmpA-like protein PdsO [Gammaproteobacteria bacterium]